MGNSDYAVLGKEWMLRGWKHSERNLVSRKTGDCYPLTEEELHALSFCDGKTNLSLPPVTTEHRAVIRLFVLRKIVFRCKKGALFDQHQAYRLAPNTYLRGVLVSVTGRCNFRCRHCYMSADKLQYGDLTKEQVFAIIEQLDAANVYECAMTGGEPFLRSDFAEILQKLQEKQICFTEVFTNASLITEETIDLLDSYHNRPVFKVSFDCIGSHDYMRGIEGAEEATLRGIRLLKKRGCYVAVITSMGKTVAQGMLETYRLLESLGVDQWWIAPPVRLGNWDCREEDMPVKEVLKVLEDVLRVWVASGRQMELRLWRLGRYHTWEDGPAYSLPTPFTEECYDCMTMACQPYILSDGTVLPCASFTGLACVNNLPNLFREPLSKIWDSPELSKFTKLKKAEVRSLNGPCQSCENFGFCGGGCRSTAFLHTGNYLCRDVQMCGLYKSGEMQRFHDLANALAEKYENMAR